MTMEITLGFGMRMNELCLNDFTSVRSRVVRNGDSKAELRDAVPPSKRFARLWNRFKEPLGGVRRSLRGLGQTVFSMGLAPALRSDFAKSRASGRRHETRRGGCGTETFGPAREDRPQTQSTTGRTFASIGT